MSTKQAPQALAATAAQAPALPTGAGERFGGYGVMGLPFTSGHYLALRHFTASSIGPGFRAVWHRDPYGRWTVYADAPPEVSCARFLGSALTATHTTQVDLEWDGPRLLTVRIPDMLTWRIEISSDFATRLMSAVGSRLPDAACRAPWLLRPMGVIAGAVLSVGKVRIAGVMPNGQIFGAVPKRVWRIEESSAVLHGRDLGVPGPLAEQERLGDFLLPQRGIFFAEGAVAFTDTDLPVDLTRDGVP